MLVTIEGDWLVVRPDPPRACEHVRLAWWLVWLAVSLAMWAGLALAAWAVVGAVRGG